VMSAVRYSRFIREFKAPVDEFRIYDYQIFLLFGGTMLI